MYLLNVDPDLDRKLKKMEKKRHVELEIINKKILEIQQNPHHFKNLSWPLGHLKRVHIYKSFVLTFQVHEDIKTVELKDYDHHDNVYHNKR